MTRPYTGTSDGAATFEGPGLRVLINYLTKKYPALWNNGTWMVRDKKGGNGLSVHATGRAVDLSYRFIKAKGLGTRFGGRRQAMQCCGWLVKNADTLGLEMILDYFPQKFGRGWKCSRGGWTKYTSKQISGAPGGDWLHVEVAPAQANSAIVMRQAIARCV